jgi:toxin CcdB
MARFDLYANPDDETRRLAPFLLDVQSTHVGILPTRIVIPLRPVHHFAFSGKPSDLLPVFEVSGEECFLDTPGMSAVPLNALGRRVASLSDHRKRSRQHLIGSSAPNDGRGSSTDPQREDLLVAHRTTAGRYRHASAPIISVSY